MHQATPMITKATRKFVETMLAKLVDWTRRLKS
jgi:hypothetical protein